MNCDAIVNAANNTLLGGGGVDGCIHRAAGPELLAECRTLGGCRTGDAKITGGYRLPARYVIHTVGPVWRDGRHGERDMLVSCYLRSLEIAKEYKLSTVAFPLISAGVYGYPKAQALRVATETVSSFLAENEMTVYIVIFDTKSYEIGSALLGEVESFIDKKYSSTLDSVHCYRKIKQAVSEKTSATAPSEPQELLDTVEASEPYSLEEMLEDMDDSFSVTLLKLIDTKGMGDVECYKRANVSKQTWYKIMNERDYKPSKNTVIAFAIALRLSLPEAKALLATVGFTLSHSSKFDIIIEYFLTKGIYDMFVINETLFKFDQVCLGA